MVQVDGGETPRAMQSSGRGWPHSRRTTWSEDLKRFDVPTLNVRGGNREAECLTVRTAWRSWLLR
jgi:hypothetical protein